VLSALIYAEEDSKRENERRTARLSSRERTRGWPSRHGMLGGGRVPGTGVRVVVESETT